MYPFGSKQITFVYKKHRHTINVSQTTTLETLISHIKGYFKINPNEAMHFVDVKTHEGLAPGSINDFWEFSTDKVPVYQIHTNKSKRFASSCPDQ